MCIQLAIDFGTTNSAVALLEDPATPPRLLSLPGLSQGTAGPQGALIPSLVDVEDGMASRILLGQQVLAQHMDRQRDSRLFRNFKRGILAHAEAEPRIIDGAAWTDREAGKAFIKALLAALPYQQRDIAQLVFTVPVGAFKRYLNWLSSELSEFPCEAVRVVDESTAAALGYSVTEPGALVLVFDFFRGVHENCL